MPPKLEETVGRMLGNLGMPAVQSGSHVIEPEEPETLPELAGHGDTVRVGDFVRVRWHDGARSGLEDTIDRVECLMGPEDCPRVQLFPINNLECVREYPLARYVRPPGAPRCHLEFRLVTQAEVDRWWEDRRLPPGWHRTATPTDSVRVLIDEDGVPAMVHRGHEDRRMEEARQWAEVVTGYNISLHARYDDREKLVREVRHATPRPPPRVPRGPSRE